MPLALGCGVAAAWLWRQAWRWPAKGGYCFLAVLLLLAAWVWPGMYHASLLTISAPELAALRYPEPFATAAEVGRDLAEQTTPQELILVVGSEPEIYFYAQRPSTCRMAIMYPMTGRYTFSAALQKDFFAQWDSLKPRYVVTTTLSTSYSDWPESVQSFVDQVLPLLKKNYVPVAKFRLAKDHAFWIFRRTTASEAGK